MPARTPEDLELLLEDACVMRDPAALGELYEEHGSFGARGPEPAAQGRQAIAQAAMAWWERGGQYVADPLNIVQARRTALIVAHSALNVARRGPDGGWRYTITLLSEQQPKGVQT
jgi:hypothetical protein